jgi:asparagine synthase (glutamine-hydrolysing)
MSSIAGNEQWVRIMSALAGLLYRERRSPERERLDALSSVNRLHGPDACAQFVGPGVALLFHGLHFDAYSRRERQPVQTPSGLVVTVDGRLDNRDDLIQQLWSALPPEAGDAVIVGAALEQWGVDALARFVGDFSVAIWDPATERVTLARDAFGNRPLHYAACEEGYLWSTCLATLVSHLHREDALDEVYIASELTFGGLADATPFRGIARVPFNTALTLGRTGIISQRPVWIEQPAQVRYGRAEAYQEHFRQLVSDAVRARLRSDRPVWCQLSGGLDSSTIVCVAARHGRSEPAIRALSIVPADAPESDSREFIDEVAAWAGVPVTVLPRAIDEDSFVRMHRRTPFDGPSTCDLVEPLMRQEGARVLLSGAGGDLLLGKTDSFILSLLDHARRADLAALWRDSFRWARRTQSTIYRVLWALAQASAGSQAIAAGELPLGRGGKGQARWRDERVADTYGLTDAFVRRTHPRPLARLEGLDAWPVNKRPLVAGVRRFAACNNFLADESTHAMRLSFPLIDRRLVEFMFAIPDSVIWKPEQDRCLMRAALEGVLPARIRLRRTKGYGQPAHLRILRRIIATLPPTRDWQVVQAGYIDFDRFTALLPRLWDGRFTGVDHVLRVVSFELWLRQRQLQKSETKGGEHDDVQQPGFSPAR